jgi:mannose-6-phosphate isomerase
MDAHFNFSAGTAKTAVIAAVADYLHSLTIDFNKVDSQRPWGAFFVVSLESLDAFLKTYFEDYDPTLVKQFGSAVSPKILLVAPGQKLSWQYHERRAELWRAVTPVGYVRSSDNTETAAKQLASGKYAQFQPQERHRLVGLEAWGVVAEIWQHIDPQHLSSEDDIVRVSDQYGR